MILRESRDWIQISVGDRTVTVYGESLFPRNKPWRFNASTRSITTWDDGQPVTKEEVVLIKSVLEQDFRDRGDPLEWD